MEFGSYLEYFPGDLVYKKFNGEGMYLCGACS